MGWNYKDEKEAVADMKETMEKLDVWALKEIGGVPVNEDGELDTKDIWYKIIKVDSDSFDALEKLEENVNKFIANTNDEFIPQGPIQQIGDYFIQTLVDVENLDNK